MNDQTPIFRWDDQPVGLPDLAEDVLAEWLDLNARARALAAELGLSKTGAADRSGVPMGTLSPWIDGTYTGSYSNTNKRVAKWIAAEAERRAAAAGELKEPPFVETRTAKQLLDVLLYAQTAPAIVLASLGAGMGKTTVARHVVATRPHTYRVRMRPSTAQVHSMLRELALTLAVEERDPGRLALAIGEKLRRNGRHTLLIIDEAQNLADKAVDELRALLDEYGTGIALLGNRDVLGRWGRSTPKDGHGQLHRRIGARLDRQNPLPEDIDTYVAAWGITDPDVVRLAHAIGRMPGALGQIAETLKLAARMAAGRGRALSAQDVSDAWTNRGGEDVR